jgi:phosphoribosylformylglycinamidine synthase
MSARGKSGMVINIDKVPVREEMMTPYEIMLSESQERMLVVTTPEHLEEVKSVFKRWGLNAVEIGQVTSGNRLIVTSNGSVLADVPAISLVLGGEAPVYVRQQKRPAYLEEAEKLDLSSISIPKNLDRVLKTLLESPSIASKRWVYEQYDTSVRISTAVGCGSSAGVIRIRKTDKALAISTDGNGRYCYLNPREGAKIAVAEAALNVAVSGGRPAAITNCLNFGNPYDPEIYYQFAECVAGMGEACRILEAPVTGGNVSFYNEDPNGAVYPTPIIGMVGIVEDIKHITTIWFMREGHDIYLTGETGDEIGASEYLKVIHGRISGSTPAIDLSIHKRTIDLVLALIREGVVVSAQDVSDGGLAVALAECCFRNRLGCSVTLDSRVRSDSLLFGESQSRAIISAPPEHHDRITQLAQDHNISLRKIGITGGLNLKINDLIDIPVVKLSRIYQEAIPKLMEHVGAV